MSTSLKTVIAVTATAFAALAYAQGTPPQPAAADPAVGAGQRSTQETPMGTTGTPGSGAATTGSTGATTGSGTMSSGSMSSGSTSGSTMSSDTSSGSGSSGTMRTARTDRN